MLAVVDGEREVFVAATRPRRRGVGTCPFVTRPSTKRVLESKSPALHIDFTATSSLDIHELKSLFSL